MKDNSNRTYDSYRENGTIYSAIGDNTNIF